MPILKAQEMNIRSIKVTWFCIHYCVLSAIEGEYDWSSWFLCPEAYNNQKINEDIHSLPKDKYNFKIEKLFVNIFQNFT